jgi:hypothetical protein
MKRTMTILFLLTSCAAIALFLAANGAGPDAYQKFLPPSQQAAPAAQVANDTASIPAKQESPARSKRQLVYHDEPPKDPLPAPLDPAQFTENKAAFVTYSIAAKIREVLYQEPCYCPCVRQRGHKSLLDCFMDQHGVRCEICHKEAIFAYEQSKAGRTPAEIRLAMEKGDAWKIDVKDYAETNYAAVRAWKR